MENEVQILLHCLLINIGKKRTKMNKLRDTFLLLDLNKNFRNYKGAVIVNTKGHD